MINNFLGIMYLDPKTIYFPRRHVIVLLGCFGLLAVYTMRINLSVAIVAMTNHNHTKTIPENSTIEEVLECPNLARNQSTNEVPSYKGEKYDWNPRIQGIILGAYYQGYVVTQLPGGILAEKFGAKWVFGGGVLATSIFSLLTPLAVSWGTTAFICVRVLQGFADGVTAPSIQIAISKWSPKMERSRASTIIFSGVMAGEVIAMTLSGVLCGLDTFGGWPSVFYLFGGMGVLWCICWFLFMYETPDIHPSISKEELFYIEDNQDVQSEKNISIPWKEMMLSAPVWAFTFAVIGHSFGYIMLMTELPTYLHTILRYDLTSNGILCAIPFILQLVVSWIASWAADKLRTTNKFSITFIRKLFNTIGMSGPPICLLAVTQSGCRPELIVALLSIGLGIDGCVFSGYNITAVDMTPNFSGTIYGIANTIGSISGVIAPMVVAYFLHGGNTTANWSKIFYTTVAIYFICSAAFLAFGSAELQQWNSGKIEEKKEKDKETNISNPVINHRISISETFKC
ncbi:putative inorganic phosphate cotransporter [Parasteatoda tepidariorum]|uniref:putative inorganic phosphate cotransporter n=1 Tax=Parasteatoda tepidariorum TaxID=114398 RepID=UPI001C71A0DF|nr:putative inorganic phosphate cotransporter [Parasteatoda tepidariorum]